MGFGAQSIRAGRLAGLLRGHTACKRRVTAAIRPNAGHTAGISGTVKLTTLLHARIWRLRVVSSAHIINITSMEGKVGDNP